MTDWRREELTDGERLGIATRERIDPELVDWSVLGEYDRCEIKRRRIGEMLSAGDEEARPMLQEEKESLDARLEELAKDDDGGESDWFDEIRELVAEDDPGRRAAMAERNEVLKRALEIVEGMKGRRGRKRKGTFEEAVARKRAYQIAYREAKRNGTWIPKKELGKGGRVVCLDGGEAARKAHEAALAAKRWEMARREAEAAEAARRAAEAERRRKEAEEACARTRGEIAEREGAAEDRRLAERELKRQAAVRKGMGKPAQSAEQDEADLEELTAIFRERRHILEEAERVAAPFFEEERAVRRAKVEALKALPEYQEYLREKEAKKKEVFEKYGFQVGKQYKRKTPQREAGRLEYQRFTEAWARKFHRERITVYNREYRRRKRAEALAEAQKLWTTEEWARWNENQRRKVMGEGTKAGFVKSVVAFLAQTGSLTEDEILARLFDAGGVEFLERGFASLGSDKARGNMVAAAARAVAFYIDPDGSVMFTPDTGRQKKKSS